MSKNQIKIKKLKYDTNRPPLLTYEEMQEMKGDAEAILIRPIKKKENG